MIETVTPNVKSWQLHELLHFVVLGRTYPGGNSEPIIRGESLYDPYF